ncbi:MAG TPA: helix-turn-helix domain-containing protein [Actinophytocola sp.]|uniref:helix-turn-helix transcriptional regulator n=1 Tax=Actinophytocola sp. TaxID=1872138 RepID=UPI002DDD0A32|nr:helix-turn-helix domain-containing protein [Actinophytocola sp.]HEV2784678.1 helix-turn-helix domain-containing protein [Actinophytocola sp.]
MQRLREARRMTQTDLAKALQRHGLRFHQQTIQRIESGERPIRLDEAFLIAEELGSSIAAMTADKPSLDQKIAEAESRLKEAVGMRDMADATIAKITGELMRLQSMARVVTQREILEVESENLTARRNAAVSEIDMLDAMIKDERDEAKRDELRDLRNARREDVLSIESQIEKMRVDLDNLRRIGI